MPWVKLDDSFPDNPKVDGLTSDAFRLYVSALCYAGRHLTDGFVEAARVPRLIPRFRRSHLNELVAAGLWLEVPGGWEIHDYLDYNPSAGKVKAERAAAAERMKKRRSSERSPEHPRERSPVRSGGRSPSPTRPDRERVGKKVTSESASAPAPAGGAERNDLETAVDNVLNAVRQHGRSGHERRPRFDEHTEAAIRHAGGWTNVCNGPDGPRFRNWFADHWQATA